MFTQHRLHKHPRKLLKDDLQEKKKKKTGWGGGGQDGKVAGGWRMAGWMGLGVVRGE